MDNHQAFLAAIEAEPLDHVLRCVFADWLDEHGDVEEATRQREWVGAYKYLLQSFVDHEERNAEANLLDQDDDALPPLTPAEALGTIESYRQSLAERGSICFGSEMAMENMWEETKRLEFYRSLEIVTGAKILPETRARASFSCGC